MGFLDKILGRGPAPPITHTILVAERSLTIQKVFELTFARSQFRLVSIRDGSELSTVLQRDLPDLVFVAIDLPTVDGFRAVAYIRAHPDVRDIPVVLLHGMTQRPEPRQLTGARINTAFQKPFDSRELLALALRLVADRPVHSPTPGPLAPK